MVFMRLVCLYLIYPRFTLGRLLHSEGKIIGGVYAEEGAYPFAVSFQFDFGRHFCGGNVLTEKTVLSACHCARLSREKRYFLFWRTETYAVAGSIDRTSKQTQKRLVSQFLSHKKCDVKQYGWVYDYGLAVLKNPFNILKIQNNIRPIQIENISLANDVQSMIRSRAVCRSMGWGSQVIVKPGAHYTGLSSVLKEVKINLMTYEACMELLCEPPKSRCVGDIEKRHQICGIGPDREDVCSGDSGSALVCNGKAVAITSWGPACGEYRYPTMYSLLNVPFQWTSGGNSILVKF
ncbi:trypsin theta-like isoform X2 [Cimex lectularius]|uniref:Peptidase S1 domain-containing protein n=1 Tax=Cimex lectularius TaxID=79782 RepID=A0A8I6SJK4_CIMLE|nr:trypsin theta-like isoform X2 [Cimex lectularius]